MVAGRNASGMASELGSMIVTEQIDAMRALGTDPTKKLITPRIGATAFMLFFLTIIADLLGLVGGWAVAHLLFGLDTNQYWTSAWQILVFRDVFTGLIKPFLFGFIIATVGCYYGMSTRGGTQGVGRSTDVGGSGFVCAHSDRRLLRHKINLRYLRSPVAMSAPTVPGEQTASTASEHSAYALEFENVSIAFDEKVVLDGISFRLPHGETKALFGVAGSGKSILLKLAIGLLRPDSGRIIVLGEEITTMSEQQLFELRRRVGIVF